MPRAAILLSQEAGSTTTRSRCGSSSSRSCPRPSGDDRVGVRPRQGDQSEGPDDLQRAVAHDRGELRRPVRIKWINGLKDAHDNYLPHLLPVDPTLHWANPPQGTNPEVNGSETRDSRPNFTATPGPLHRPRADGHARPRCRRGQRRERWLRRGVVSAGCDEHPGGLRQGRHLVRILQGQGRGEFGATWGPGFAAFQYPNSQRASTVWYHDHTLGMTRLNVYAGPAGFYIVRGGPAGDLRLRDTRTGRLALLPGPLRARSTRSSRTGTSTRFRSPSRTARSTTTARFSTPTRARSSATLPRTVRSRASFPRVTCRRSRTPSSSAT